MAIKHKPTGIIHSGVKGGLTGCGFDTKGNPDHWINTHEKLIVIRMDVRISLN